MMLKFKTHLHHGLLSVFAVVLIAASSASYGQTVSHTINTSDGKSINRGILGENIYCQTTPQFRAKELGIIYNSSMRGVAGGLWADSYDWRKLTASYLGPQTTLQMLREVRDRNAEMFIIANCRGIGTGTGSAFAYTDKTVPTIASVAADWVRYTNCIVQKYRKDDPITGRDADILNSLAWGTEDKLLSREEKQTRKVKYWEIGNEPEVPLDVITNLTPDEYLARYKAMAAAMVAEDPTIQVGPCITTVGSNGNAWLQGVLNDQTCRVDFIAYHPYGPLYWLTKNVSGGVLDGPTLESGLVYIKQQQQERMQAVLDAITASGRSSSIPLMLTEWNPSSWEGTYYYGLCKTVAHGLGLAESIFTFAELGIQHAMYWDHPCYPNVNVENPGFKVYEEMQNYLGDKLTDSYSDGSFRLYTTRDTATNNVVLWAINMSNTQDKLINLSLTNLGYTDAYITKMALAAKTGDTTLVMQNSSSEIIDWTTTDLTGQLNLSSFDMTFDNATLTVLIIRPKPE